MHAISRRFAPAAAVALLVLLPTVRLCADASGATKSDNAAVARTSRAAVVTFTDVGAALTGVYNSSVAWGDYDNDGDLDMVVTGYTGSAYIAKLYRNSGGANPTFTDVGAGLTGVQQSSVAWGDYDGDGNLDLLITGFTISGPITKLYHNSGGANPTFTDVGAMLTGVDVSSVAWGDYDNDGDLDLLVTGSDSNFVARTILYRNNGGPNPTFTDVGAGLIGVQQSSVAWGDYDNDGDLDILITGQSATGPVARIYRNSGGANPTFTDIGAGLTGVSLSSVAWGDYDNDGDLDILLTGFTGTTRITKLYVSSGGANPTFTEATTSLTNVQSSSVAWGDYDNDGDLDVLLTGYDPGNIPTTKLFRYDGAVFNTVATAPTGLTAVQNASGVTLSWNASTDGQTPAAGLTYNLRVGTTPGGSDIVSPMAPASGYRRVAQLGNTQERRSWSLRIPPGIYYWSVQAVDGAFAGSAFASEQTLMLPGITLVPTSLVAVANGSVAWGDYDNDGDLDILLTGDNGAGPISKIYRNDGNGTFVDIGAGLTGVSYSSVAWGDYDGDGDLDILLTGADASSTPIAKVYRNDGNGTFTDIGASLTGVDGGGVGGSAVAWGDYDNDGDLDILLSGYDGTTYITKVYRNDGNGIFTDIGAGLPGILGSVAWGDYDNDGDLDIALAGFDGTQRIGKVYRNDSGTFVDILAQIPAVSSSSLAWGDYDNDGDLDLFVAGSENLGSNTSSSVVRNDGSDTFTGVLALTGVFHGSVAWGDYDNDGDLDILLTGNSSTFTQAVVSKLYRNDGIIAGVPTFTDIGAGLPGVDFSSVAWGDYDNDGNLDFLITGRNAAGNQVTSLYRNAGRPPNAPPSPPTNLNAVRNGGNVTFSWSPAIDDHTPASGLSYNLRVGITPGGDEIVPGMAVANGYRKVPRLGNAQERTSWTVALPPGPCYWSVQAIDGSFHGSPFASSTVAVDQAQELPVAFALDPPAPNPFAARVSLGFALPRATRVDVSVFDVMGRKVRVLDRGSLPAGMHRVDWDGRDEAGIRVKDGVYLVRMAAAGQSWTRKLVLAR